MKRIVSCEFNMDTGCVETKYDNGCSNPICFSVSEWLTVLEAMLEGELPVDILRTKYLKRIFVL